VDHLQFFGFSEDPFTNDLRLDFYFASPQHDEAKQRLLRCLQQGKALTVFLGSAGHGKTTVVRHLLEELDEARFEASVLVMLHGAVGSGWLLARVARQLSVELPAAERAQLVGQIYEQLVALREAGRRCVLFVDEAQLLASAEPLEELRGLLNLEYEERNLLSLVLVGSPELEGVLDLDFSLAQRVEAKVRLEALNLNAACEYVEYRVQRVGGDLALFDPKALKTLCRVARGVPRLLNTLADNALYEASRARRRAVSEPDVLRAAQDLGLLKPDRAEPAGEPSLSEMPTGGLPAGALRAALSRAAAPQRVAAPSHAEPELETALVFEEPEPQFLFPQGPPPKEDELDDLFSNLVDEGER